MAGRLPVKVSNGGIRFAYAVPSPSVRAQSICFLAIEISDVEVQLQRMIVSKRGK